MKPTAGATGATRNSALREQRVQPQQHSLLSVSQQLKQRAAQTQSKRSSLPTLARVLCRQHNSRSSAMHKHDRIVVNGCLIVAACLSIILMVIG